MRNEDDAEVTKKATNVEAEVNGNRLQLYVDLDEGLSMSASGKSYLVASSGRHEIEYEGRKIRINLSVFEERRHMSEERRKALGV